jgi:hypothetical protein
MMLSKTTFKFLLVRVCIAMIGWVKQFMAADLRKFPNVVFVFVRSILIVALVPLQLSVLIANAVAQTEQRESRDQRPDLGAAQSSGQNGNGRGGKSAQSEGQGRGGQRDGEVGKNGGGGKGVGKTGGSGLGNYTVPPPANNVPEHLFNIVLGRPTDHGITVRVLFHKAATAFITYGTESGKLTEKTPSLEFTAKATHDFVLDSLKPDTRYYYKLVYKSEFTAEQTTDEYTFHTQRKPGSSFVFTVTSDSHLDENTSGEVYLRTLANALHDSPDFHFELGDTFMTGKYVRPELSEPQYLAQRYYLGSLCHSASLFFALGNHDGESGSRGSLAWATKKRKELVPNPFPNGFYSGNQQKEGKLGFPENYYQWKWGDAQFIVLDPFRYTKGRGNGVDHWLWTLGEQQYQWLHQSLKGSDSKFKFIFLHHLVGGAIPHARGGVESVPYWEWGGKGASGENEFAKQRPGWEAPIHDLLVKYGVTVVFHGHDHMFIKQDLDGIVYQLVPQPGHPRSGNIRTATEYGYLTGETQSSSGHVRVRVNGDSVRADYVRSYLPQSETRNNRNGEVSFSYVASDHSARH